MAQTNAWKTLDIAPGSSKEQIRAAYRTLARRWHPDRFMQGPERDWANEKMAEINAAYRACLTGKVQTKTVDEQSRLREIEELIGQGNYHTAREQLMRLETRCAEWNYLFGAVLLRLADTEKALIYLSVAAHQNPENAKYAALLAEAQSRPKFRLFRKK